ncbi:hypothetical protein UFOVP96_1 [uncultured Caudovirales phage]|uniref:Uncharacterized protein n=1 Tax=uncultured Caudovirales phage TaxID=2100421 RepID=A0A6J5L3I2_9CAUD|nr:hypothetical protein UFOVP96_1 [uncultured Caudovirales phage]
MATSNPGPAVTQGGHPQVLSSNQAVRLLASYQGVNANASGDTVLPLLDSSSYSVKFVVFTNASISLTTAAAGVFTAPSASGAIVANAALSALTGPTVVSERTVASTAVQTGQNLYVNVGTAQGAAATFDVYVYGYDFTTL